MKKIGIITAMTEEFEVIEKLMENIEIIDKYNLKLYTGIINGKEVVLVKCGVGKVNSARTTQILIRNMISLLKELAIKYPKNIKIIDEEE